MQLYESGSIRLDEQITTYFPDYLYAAGITIHHLLSSASGIPDYTELPEYSTRSKLTAEIIIEWLKKKPLQFEPGKRTEKSNSNFVFLAKIVEAVSGMDIEEYYDRMIFKPAGLEHTGVCRNEDVIPDKACGYSYSGEGVVRAEYYEMSGAYGSGFLYSNAEDLLKWVKALYEGNVISRNSYDRMITPNGFLWYTGAATGYGCFVKGDPTEEVFMDGNIHGYTCTVHRFHKNDCTVIVLGNNDAIPISRIVKGLKSILFSEESAGMMVVPDLMESVDYEPYKYLAGEYVFPPMGWRFAVSFEDRMLKVDRLFIQESKRKKFQLKLVSDNSTTIVLACAVCDSTYTLIG